MMLCCGVCVCMVLHHCGVELRDIYNYIYTMIYIQLYIYNYTCGVYKEQLLRMYMHACIHIHTSNMYRDVHLRARRSSYTYIHTYIHAFVHIHTSNMYRRAHFFATRFSCALKKQCIRALSVWIVIFSDMCVCVCMYVCMYVHVRKQ